jgi:hypothetical protein
VPLFRNNKREADTDAEYKGTVNIEGTEYWINAATAPWLWAFLSLFWT